MRLDTYPFHCRKANYMMFLDGNTSQHSLIGKDVCGTKTRLLRDHK